MSDLNVDGMALAPGVVETIVSIAVAEVDGVASVGGASAANRGIRAALGSKPATAGIQVAPGEDDALQISVRRRILWARAARRGGGGAPVRGRCRGKPGWRNG